MPLLPPVDISTIQTRLFIGGKWVDGLAGGEIDVFNPYTGKKLVAIAEAREEDVDRAVAAAQAAAPGWARLAAHERGSWPTPSRPMPTISSDWKPPTPVTRYGIA